MTNAETEESKAVIKSVKGTLTLHAISTDNHVNLIKRNPICACCNCFNSADVSDKALHIDLMVESGKVVKRFRWSKKQDTLWINSKYIIRKIQHPIATGKGGRLFRVSEDVMEFIETYNSN